jgi:hypothetical protein
MNDHQANEVHALVQQIGTILYGHKPEIQCAVIGDLLSILLSGHHPALREQTLERIIRLALELIPENERMLFERYGGKPEGWAKQ